MREWEVMKVVEKRYISAVHFTILPKIHDNSNKPSKAKIQKNKQTKNIPCSLEQKKDTHMSEIDLNFNNDLFKKKKWQRNLLTGATLR